jgi:hypothetical protein
MGMLHTVACADACCALPSLRFELGLLHFPRRRLQERAALEEMRVNFEVQLQLARAEVAKAQVRAAQIAQCTA